MPGPVSDSYDPEFGTSANAEMVELAISSVVNRINMLLGADLRNIVAVVHDEGEWPVHQLVFTEQELRVIRFGLNRALETL